MHYRNTVRPAAAALLLLVSAAPAQAAVVAFTGTATATAMVFSDPTCAPLPFRGIIHPETSSGSSNLGSFTYGHKTCTQGATGPLAGEFALDFGDGTLSGSMLGTSTARAGTPGLFDQVIDYTVTGGSGRFMHVTGTFQDIGTVDVRGGPPSRLNFNFTGLLAGVSVPEPGTWALFILGLGLCGREMRQRRRNFAMPNHRLAPSM